MRSSDEGGARLRVIVVVGSRLLAECLPRLLQKYGLEVLVSTSDPAAALEGVGREPCDIAVVDLDAPTFDGPETIRRLTTDGRVAGVVAVGSDLRPSTAARAIDAGAGGVFGKEHGGSDLVDTIRRVARGECVLPQESLRTVAPATGEGTAVLTDREAEVLSLLAAGYGAQAVATQLGIRYSTARTHIQNLLTKLGAHSRLEAIALAAGERLIPDLTPTPRSEPV